MGLCVCEYIPRQSHALLPMGSQGQPVGVPFGPFRPAASPRGCRLSALPRAPLPKLVHFRLLEANLSQLTFSSRVSSLAASSPPFPMEVGGTLIPIGGLLFLGESPGKGLSIKESGRGERRSRRLIG